MSKPRLDLETNPEFLADLLNDEMSRSAITEKWGCSDGFVSDRRKKARAGRSIVSPDWLNVNPEAQAPNETSDRYENADGTVTYKFIRHRPVTLEDARNLIRSSGDNPDAYRINIRAIGYGHDQSSNKIEAIQKVGMDLVETFPLDHLYAEAKKKIGARTPVPALERATVVCVADMQLGKTGRRGGTPETLARLEHKRDQLAAALKARRPSRVLVADLGDGIEGFESGGNPMFTNDMSLPDQIDCYSTEMFKFIALASRFAPVDVTVVASNHSAWRKAKQQLGRPSDDFGIHVHKQVAKVAEAAGIDATFHYPEDYDESVRVDVMGVPLGFVHGNQFGPGQAISWWEKQAFGAQAVTHCDVLVSGHYHCFGSGAAGTNPSTGRERMWLGAPTLDNGSDWFRQTAGRDSEPGLLIFDVTPDGFDLGSLTIL